LSPAARGGTLPSRSGAETFSTRAIFVRNLLLRWLSLFVSLSAPFFPFFSSPDLFFHCAVASVPRFCYSLRRAKRPFKSRLASSCPTSCFIFRQHLCHPFFPRQETENRLYIKRTCAVVVCAGLPFCGPPITRDDRRWLS